MPIWDNPCLLIFVKISNPIISQVAANPISNETPTSHLVNSILHVVLCCRYVARSRFKILKKILFYFKHLVYAQGVFVMDIFPYNIIKLSQKVKDVQSEKICLFMLSKSSLKSNVFMC